MLTRFYADNFLCLVNFELTLGETNILLGPNGSGKTSVLRALRGIQALVAQGFKINEILTTRDLTLFQDRDVQRFEIDLLLDRNSYRYALTLQHNRARRRIRILEEVLLHDDKPILEFRKGEIQLYRDDYTTGPSFPFDWSRSGVGALHARPDNQKLTNFRKAMANFIIVSPCPPLFEPEARTEDEILDPLMQNFVGWYRHAVQENMGAVTELFQMLGDALPEFDSLILPESGENARTLKVCFRHPDSKHEINRYGFDQLSDGQKSLVALYSLLVLSGSHRASLFLDEPDNYISGREVQPWLAAVEERCGDTLEQAVVISHHPITIDYMAGATGKWFYRDGEGPARVANEPERAVESLSASELIARGWDR